MNTGKLLQFLFVESQNVDAVDAYIETINEELKDLDSIKEKKSTLSKVIKAAGLPVKGLEETPEGYKLELSDEDTYRRFTSVFHSVDGMHSLAQAGWIALFSDNQSRPDEEPNFRISFLSTNEIQPSSIGAVKSMDDLIKQAREFADQEPEDAINVQKPERSKGSGIGKAKAGEKAKKTY